MPFPLATISFVEPGSRGTSTRTFDSTDELGETLAELYSAYADAPPILARITRSNLDSLLIGLGRPYLANSAPDSPIRAPADVSCLAFESNSGDPPYYSARTGNTATESLVWFLDGHWTELPPSTAIPFSTAIEAIKEFVSVLGLPSSVHWQED
jgi:immunity protein Imm1 of predicted polymorphic toxin system